MDIITVNVGQGALALVRHNKEAIIIDSKIPPSDDKTVAFVKQMLATALTGHNVKGLVLTGFDDDHSDVTGIAIALRKYRPDWVLHPQYRKDSTEARLVRQLIVEQEKERANSPKPLKVLAVTLDRLANRRLLGLSTNFDLELFSPHCDDMDSSNNCSVVLKLTGLGPGGFSYLITGDTEVARWENIAKFFGGALRSHVLAAAHHGSRNGVHPASLIYISPHTVLISAGVENQYGHPHPAAVNVYSAVAKQVFSTNMQGGVSLLTRLGPSGLSTTLIPGLAA